eukprot:2177751-Pyramimonas_sp.AAC.1
MAFISQQIYHRRSKDIARLHNAQCTARVDAHNSPLTCAMCVSVPSSFADCARTRGDCANGARAIWAPVCTSVIILLRPAA